MLRDELRYQISQTLADSIEDFDLDAIIDGIAAHVGGLGAINHVDDVEGEVYWEIVRRHDISQDETEKGTHTVLTGETFSTVSGEWCELEVMKEVGGAEPNELSIELPLSVHDDDVLGKIDAVADAALEKHGWKRVGPWEQETDGSRAPVRRA